MARVPKQITGNAGAFDVIKKGGKEFKEVGAGKITHFNNGKKAPLKEDVTAARKGAPGFPNARPVSAEEAKRLTGSDNAGLNAPHFDNWTNNGGWLKYDDETGSVIYGKNMQTSNHGMQNVEVPYVNGKPDFSEYTSYQTQIRQFDGDRVDDYYEANKRLIEDNPELAQKAGVVRNDGDAYRSRPKARGEDGQQLFVWHHHEDGTSMLLVDYNVHDLFTHAGGHSGK